MEKKTKMMQIMEEKMQEVEEGSLRHEVLQAAMNFKKSWIQLGRYLYTVERDKMYKEWGYLTFEAYCAKEIGIRKQTAVKLLRSYYFLESEEPEYLKIERAERDTVRKLPSYEAVNLLRLAKVNKNLDKSDYQVLRENVLDKGKDIKEVKKEFVMMKNENKDPQEERQNRRVSTIRRMISTLTSLKQEMEDAEMLPKPLSTDVQKLITRLQEQLK
jgi:hypothetical protein